MVAIENNLLGLWFETPNGVLIGGNGSLKSEVSINSMKCALAKCGGLKGLVGLLSKVE
jgi:hypothetical protein